MEDSVELRVFADQPDANAATAQLDNPNFLGKVFLFGMGGAKSAGLSPIIPFSRKLDVTSLIADDQVKGTLQNSLPSRLTAGKLGPVQR